MALSSYSTPMGKVLGIREDMRGGGGGQTDRQTGEMERQRNRDIRWRRYKKATQSKYIYLSLFDFVCL